MHAWKACRGFTLPRGFESHSLRQCQDNSSSTIFVFLQVYDGDPDLISKIPKSNSFPALFQPVRLLIVTPPAESVFPSQQISLVPAASGFCAVGFFNCCVSVEKIARQIESPYYFFVVTFGNSLVLSMKRNGKGSFAAVYIRMIDFRMLSPVSDFKLTVVI